MLLLLALLAAAQAQDVVLATTTSTRDAGLLDSLLPHFERRSGHHVKVVAVGSGQALEMARRGDADVVLSHAPDAELALADSGYFVRRRPVMYNDFVLVGPPSDPAGLRGERDVVVALARLARRGAGALFVSRGDRSGTHMLETKLWRLAGVRPPPPVPAPPGAGWYLEAGQGMAATLQIADQKRAYTLTDRATYLAWRDKLELVPLVEGDARLYNIYHVMESAAVPAARAAAARALADFFVSPEAQAMIAAFGRARFGQSLFFPAASSAVPATLPRP
ncbi:MAG: substrate-binding domain-containing protein [Gemmatimonadales bacterium]